MFPCFFTKISRNSEIAAKASGSSSLSEMNPDLSSSNSAQSFLTFPL